VLWNLGTHEKELVWQKILAPGLPDPKSLAELSHRLSGFNVQQTFNKFFRSRQDEKHGLYYKVVLGGGIMCVIGLIILVVVYNLDSSTALWPAILVFGNFVRVVGVCVYSTVSPQEVSLDVDYTVPLLPYIHKIFALAL
jgi:hypothetical protein